MPEEKKKTIWNKMFICTSAAYFLFCMSHYLVTTLIASYASFLGAGIVLVGTISGLYFGISFVARPFSGPAITKFNKKTIMIIVLLLGVIVNTAYIFTKNITLFIMVRILHGIMFAFIGSLNLTLAADSLPKEKMTSGLGIFGIGSAIAMAIGPAIGIEIKAWGERIADESLGYIMVFAAAAVVMALSLIPCFLLPYKKNTQEEKASLGAWYKNIIAVEAILPTLVLVFFSMSSLIYVTYMVPFAEANSINNISLFFTVYAVVLLASRPLFGRLTDKYGVNRTFYPSVIVYAASFIVVSQSTSLGMCLFGAVLAAAGYGAIQPALQTLCMQSVSPLRRGVASNTAYFGMDLGFFLGPTLGGVLISWFGYSKMIMGTVAFIAVGVLIFAIGWSAFQKKIEAHK